MKPHEKKMERYLLFSSILFLVGFWLGNAWHMIPSNSFQQKFEYLFYDFGWEPIQNHWLEWFLTPSFVAWILGILFFILGMLIYLYDNDHGTYRKGEEHGSAKLSTLQDMKKYRDTIQKNNIILSQGIHISLFNERLPIHLQKNKNVLVIGDSGSAKTLSYIKTNLMQMNSSFIVTDPDGGIVHTLGTLLTENGYTIKVFDLNSLNNSDSFNVFTYIKSEIDVDRVLEAITEATKKGEKEGEEFWIQSEALLIRSFIAFLWFDGQDNHYLPHLGMIADMLRMTERTDPKVPSPVEEWFEELEARRPDNYAYKQWKLFNDMYSAQTRMSVLATASSRYSKFDHEQVVQLVKRDTMAIDSWNEIKTAVFIAIPETSTTYNFLASLFLATISEVLRNKSDKVRQGDLILPEKNRLLHVRFLVDEFANIGRIPNFEKLLTTFRKREMSFSIILQSLNQLQEMYRHSWETVVNGCASLVYLGGDEEKTLKYLEQRIGKQTISIRKHSISGNHKSGSESRDSLGKSVMTMDEIAKLRGDECLVFITKEHAVLDKKFYAFNHPYGDHLAKTPQDKHWFTYVRYKDEVEELLAKVRPTEVIDHGIIE